MANTDADVGTAFERRLKQAAIDTETYLDASLSRRGDAPKRLAEAMRHASLGGGKRIRPFLVIESARMLGHQGLGPLAVAAALECIHCYSLVHDDLPAMDNDLLRRGRPTVWRAYDEWTAILAGDALLTIAFEMVSLPAVPLSDRAKLSLVNELARASGWHGMVGGQAIDLEADKLGHPEAPDETHVRTLQAMKTGALIRFGATAGALIDGANASVHASLEAYGRAIGLAFQIADDLLDAEGDAETVGKAVGKDAAAGKATLVGILGAERARAELAAAHTAAIAALEPFGDDATSLTALADFIVTRNH